ncbi:MAG: M15 family metallopeptidase [Lachnospiraceae bacterium]|nr:M15 family metallopeptidase [Lachnospiraceae bacterium]
MKQKRIREQRKRKLVFMVWSLLGFIGLLWLVSLPIRLMAGGPGREAGTVREKESEVANVSPAKLPYTEAGDVQAQSDMPVNTNYPGETHQDNDTALLVQKCKELYEEQPELLVLVNRDRELEPGAYEDTLRSICNGRLQACDYLYEDLVDMLAAAGDEGYHYWIASAYRSRERQQELVDEDVNRYMAQGMSRKDALEKTYEQTMPAGKSEHETGLALDLLCSENLNMDITQAKEPGNKWLAEHAHEYGFILRYPEDREDITGIYYEPWHFRYVGRATAGFLYENQLTLEEFYEYLEK